MSSNTFYDDNIGEAIDRWNPDNIKEGTQGKLVKKGDKMYEGYIVDEVKDNQKTGNKIKVYHFFFKVGDLTRKVKFGKESMQKWEAKYGVDVKKWANKDGIITFGKVGSQKYVIVTPMGTLDDKTP